MDLVDFHEIGALEQLWERFSVLDSELQTDTEQYESLFQSGPMKYYFYDMPANFDVDDFIASWKSLGAYEARESLGDDYVNERNEHIGNLSHNNVVQMPPPEQLERGMTLKKEKVEKMLEMIRLRIFSNFKKLGFVKKGHVVSVAVLNESK